MERREYTFINQYCNYMHNIRQDVVLGIGDDCALLSIDKKKWIAVSTDILASGTHFLPDIDPFDLGYKSLAVNLSDLAAMGAEPAWVSLGITMPQIDEVWLSSFSKSLFQQLDYYNMQLIGGDTARGPLSIVITIQGFLPAGNAMTRNGACVNDFIYVTGTLGDSAAGLAILQNQLQLHDTQDRQYLLNRHLRPKARIKEGKILRNLANAAIDVSDGIMLDLKHILARSDCGALINLDTIPISSTLLRSTTQEKAMHWALVGGEDYELCFTAPKVRHDILCTAMSHIGTPLTCIGQVKPKKEGIQFIYKHQSVEYNETGYDHFSN